MSRLAFCLFLIAIFHNGIVKVSHADETTTEGISKTNEEAEVTAKPVVVEDEVIPIKVESQAKTGVPPVNTEPEEAVDPAIHSKAAMPIGDKDASNKEGNIEDRFYKHKEVFFQIPKNVLGQSTHQAINAIGEQVGAAVVKTFNTAKQFANAPFGFAQSAVNSAFSKDFQMAYSSS